MTDGQRTDFPSFVLKPFAAQDSDWEFPTDPSVRGGRLGVFPTRQTIGPPDPDLDDTFSTVNWEDLSAGVGIRVMNPSSDTNRTTWSTADTRYTDGFTNPPLVTSAQPASFTGDARLLGLIGTSIYALWGLGIHRWDPDTLTWGNAVQTLTGVSGIQDEGCSWHDKWYIPLGSAGYAYLYESSPGTLAAPGYVVGIGTPTSNIPVPSTAPMPRLFTVWNQNLWALTTFAQGYALAQCPDNDGDGIAEDGEWHWEYQTNRSAFVKLSKSLFPRKLIGFISPTGEKALWLITNRGGLRYSEADLNWEHTNLWDVPPHPDFGLASIVYHAGEDLWIASGGGDMVQYTTNNVAQFGQGPAGTGDGIPFSKRGSIVSLAGDMANMWALARNDGDVASVLSYTGKGWHPLWEAAVSVSAPTSTIIVGDATKGDGTTDYRLFWSAGELVYSMPLRLTSYSSRQGREAGADDFASSSYIELPEFNGGSIAKKKLFSHVAVLMNHGAEDDEFVQLSYRTDADGPNIWHTFGDAWNPDEPTVLPLTIATGPEGSFNPGISAYWIKFLIEFNNLTGITTTTPDLRAFSLAYLATPMDAENLVINVPLPIDIDKSTQKGRDEIMQRLFSLIQPTTASPYAADISEPQFCLLKYGNVLRRVYVAGVSFVRALSESQAVDGMLQVNLIQLKSRDGITIGND